MGRSSKHPVKAVYILILEQVAQTQLPGTEHENKALDSTQTCHDHRNDPEASHVQPLTCQSLLLQADQGTVPTMCRQGPLCGTVSLERPRHIRGCPMRGYTKKPAWGRRVVMRSMRRREVAPVGTTCASERCRPFIVKPIGRHTEPLCSSPDYTRQRRTCWYGCDSQRREVSWI